MKIVWICHFSNSEIQDIIKPSRRIPDFAPWISNTIRVFENSQSVELHVISPHEFIPRTREFMLGGVHYHFFNAHIPIWGRHWPAFFKFDYLTDYWLNRFIIGRLVHRIKPDIIHLQGAENAYYSSSVFQFKGKYPIVINVQCFKLDRSLLTSFSRVYRKRIRIENSILQGFKHFSIRTTKMEMELKAFNPQAVTHWVRYKMAAISPIKTEKEYDIVFYGQINKTKGFEDLLEAVAVVKKRMPKIRLLVIGSPSPDYKLVISRIINELDIGENITWIGYMNSLQDVYKEVSKARISVLPSHVDIIPGTIIESMSLGLPVVSYKAGSIPELNSEQENVLLVEIGDIKGLAHNILLLLADSDFATDMSRRGIECVRKKYNEIDVLGEHRSCYQKVIADFQNQEKVHST